MATCQPSYSAEQVACAETTVRAIEDAFREYTNREVEKCSHISIYGLSLPWAFDGVSWPKTSASIYVNAHNAGHCDCAHQSICEPFNSHTNYPWRFAVAKQSNLLTLCWGVQIANMIRHVISNFQKVHSIFLFLNESPWCLRLHNSAPWLLLNLISGHDFAQVHPQLQEQTVLTCFRIQMASVKPVLQPIPAILEIPSKEHPYNAKQDSILTRVAGMLGGDDSWRPSQVHERAFACCWTHVLRSRWPWPFALPLSYMCAER